MSKIYGIGDEEELAEDLQNEIPNRIIDELEKIKAELNDYHLVAGERDPEVTFEIGKQLARKVIDEHIDKLKGGTR